MQDGSIKTAHYYVMHNKVFTQAPAHLRKSRQRFYQVSPKTSLQKYHVRKLAADFKAHFQPVYWAGDVVKYWR